LTSSGISGGIRRRRAELRGSTLSTPSSTRTILQEARFLLDYRPKEEIEQLYRSLDEPLVNYLNFFEFTAVLLTMGQLSLPEIRMLFQYYLDLLNEHPPIMRFIETQGFENLRSLIDAIGVPK
jgi:hypothetical protein